MANKKNGFETRTFYMSKGHLKELAKIARNRRIGERKPSASALIAEAVEFWLKNREAAASGQRVVAGN